MSINATQASLLNTIITNNGISTQGVDGRTVRALTNRGLVKLTKNGTFAKATAKGKKFQEAAN